VTGAVDEGALKGEGDGAGVDDLGALGGVVDRAAEVRLGKIKCEVVEREREREREGERGRERERDARSPTAVTRQQGDATRALSATLQKRGQGHQEERLEPQRVPRGDDGALPALGRHGALEAPCREALDARERLLPHRLLPLVPRHLPRPPRFCKVAESPAHPARSVSAAAAAARRGTRVHAGARDAAGHGMRASRPQEGTRRVQLVREGGTRRVQLVREGGGGQASKCLAGSKPGAASASRSVRRGGRPAELESDLRLVRGERRGVSD